MTCKNIFDLDTEQDDYLVEACLEDLLALELKCSMEIARRLAKHETKLGEIKRSTRSSFGTRLRDARVRKDMTQTQLSVYLGISRPMVSQIETGELSLPEKYMEAATLFISKK